MSYHASVGGACHSPPSWGDYDQNQAHSFGLHDPLRHWDDHDADRLSPGRADRGSDQQHPHFAVALDQPFFCALEHGIPQPHPNDTGDLHWLLPHGAGLDTVPAIAPFPPARISFTQNASISGGMVPHSAGADNSTLRGGGPASEASDHPLPFHSPALLDLHMAPPPVLQGGQVLCLPDQTKILFAGSHTSDHQPPKVITHE